MRKAYLLLFTLLLSLSFTRPLAAAVKTWEIDVAHSNFYFSVDHIYSKVRGHFNSYEGTIRFDPDKAAESAFSFSIKIDSIDTNNAKRDKHLQSADFFDAATFPVMTFQSSRVVAAGPGRLDVFGTFTVEGVAYELMLPLTLAGVKDHPAIKGKQVVGFNGVLTLDRLAYKVGDGKLYKLGLVGKDVEVLVSIEALADK